MDSMTIAAVSMRSRVETEAERGIEDEAGRRSG